jgi:hypothetical protein
MAPEGYADHLFNDGSERSAMLSFHRVPSRSLVGPLRQAMLVALVALAPWVAQASTVCEHAVTLTFTEGAPRDLFEIRNGSSPGQRIQSLTLDLAPSAGRLVFDTVEGGTGVEVFQPFRAETSEARLADAPTVADGSDRLALTFSQFDPGQIFRFSIDVDDRLTASDLGQIRVSGREMEGALLTVLVGPVGQPGSGRTARVGGDNVARLQQACL